MIRLILKLKDTQLEEFSPEKDLIYIGRSKENDICIDNIAVSRRHVQIERKGELGYFLRDLHSSNGTLLNGAQIDVNDHELHEGDVIGIAKFQVVVKGLALASPPSPSEVLAAEGEGTMIFGAASHKPGPESAAASSQALHWPTFAATQGPLKGRQFKITKEVTTLGKSSRDDIPVEGWFVSSPHAKISRRGDRFYITPLGGFFSRTRVNGITIQEDHILKNKDEVRIGNSLFSFTQ